MIFVDKGLCKGQVFINKNAFSLNEPIFIRCIVNNSGCKEDIKKTRIKIIRFITIVNRDKNKNKSS
jgi:hypothetical protein